MKPPPGARISIDLDADGRKLVQWEAISQRAAQVWGAVLLAAAAVCAYAGRDRPGELRQLLYDASAGQPNWGRLELIGGMMDPRPPTCVTRLFRIIPLP